MAKLIMMYEQPKDKAGFDHHYFNVHVPIGNKKRALRLKKTIYII